MSLTLVSNLIKVRVVLQSTDKSMRIYLGENSAPSDSDEFSFSQTGNSVMLFWKGDSGICSRIWNFVRPAHNSNLIVILLFVQIECELCSIIYLCIYFCCLCSIIICMLPFCNKKK